MRRSNTAIAEKRDENPESSLISKETVNKVRASELPRIFLATSPEVLSLWSLKDFAVLKIQRRSNLPSLSREQKLN